MILASWSPFSIAFVVVVVVVVAVAVVVRVRRDAARVGLKEALKKEAMRNSGPGAGGP